MHVGQEVVCIDDSGQGNPIQAPPLIRGRHYTILGLSICACGAVAVDVGIESPLRCVIHCECGHIEPANGVWPCRASRFAPIEFISETTIESILEEMGSVV